MEDRLREVAHTLHTFAEQDASLADLTAGTDKVVEACRANNGELCFARIQEWIKTEFFTADATNDLTEEIERAHGVLERIGQHAEKLRATLTADGLTISFAVQDHSEPFPTKRQVPVYPVIMLGATSNKICLD
jgi:hypothetical protein